MVISESQITTPVIKMVRVCVWGRGVIGGVNLLCVTALYAGLPVNERES